MNKMMQFLALLGIAVLLGACGSSGNDNEDQAKEADQGNVAENTGDGNTSEENSEAQNGTMGLQLLSDDQHGEYLADSEGMTLYYFINDEPGKSNCTEDCLENWPPFNEDVTGVPEGYDEKDFGTVTRQDTGETQVTYKDYPLYYFKKDQEQGDVNGQGAKDAWYIVTKDTEFK